MAEPLVIRLDKDIWGYCKEAADLWGVTAVVHPSDFMFAFHMKMIPSRRDAVAGYFRSGAETTVALTEIMGKLGWDFKQPNGTARLLEFASGYGRMTRHLNKVIPSPQLRCCDIHPEAVQFIQQALGVHTSISCARPEEFALDESFDFISAISFFSHMPEGTFGSWLDALARHLRPGGYLILTTHGQPAFVKADPNYIKTSPALPPSGFLFAPSSEQEDLDGEEYGAMFVTAEFVRERLQTVPLEEVLFSEETWWGQDLYVLRRR